MEGRDRHLVGDVYWLGKQLVQDSNKGTWANLITDPATLQFVFDSRQLPLCPTPAVERFPRPTVLYEKHISRPRVTGGVRQSIQKRYRAVFDKFLPFAQTQAVSVWNGVSANLLTKYADHLEANGTLTEHCSMS